MSGDPFAEPFIGRVLPPGDAVRALGRAEVYALESPATPGAILAFEVAAGRAAHARALASAGSARAAIYGVVDDAGLDPRFGEAVLDEVRALVASPGLDDPSLVALDDVPFVTIDGPGTRDLDQALHLEAVPEGYRVRYAIADAAYYVRPGSALFARALAHGASFYLPGLVVPMLPRPLSEALVSLGPEADKRALVFDTRIAPDGRVLGTEVYRARVRSRAKLAFGEVQAFLAAESTHPFAAQPFAESLRLLPTVGAARLADAAMRDVVRYRREETEVRLDGAGEGFVVARAARYEVELWNEQLSLLCNAEGARFVLEGAADAPYVAPIYRVHPAPPPERVEALARTIDRVVALHHLDPAVFALGASRALSAYVAALPLDGPHARVAAALERQVVLTNVRSAFTATPGAHHGVGADPYARFSAPMREIVGVYVHGEATEKLAGRPLRSFDQSEALRDAVIDAANRAKDRQRQLSDAANRLVLDRLFAADLEAEPRPVRSGTVLGVSASKVYVLLDEPPIEVKVYIGDLGKVARSFLRLDDAEASLVDGRGRPVIAVGDAITLRVEGRDPDRDRYVVVPTVLPRMRDRR